MSGKTGRIVYGESKDSNKKTLKYKQIKTDKGPHGKRSTKNPL